MHCDEGRNFLLRTGPVVCAAQHYEGAKYPIVVLFGDGFSLFVFVMHHPTGVEKNGQQNLEVAVDVP